MSYKLPVQTVAAPTPADFFISCAREAYGPMPAELVGKISSAWFKFVGKNDPVTVFKVDGPTLLHDVKHLGET
jgi:hypothetical protein